MFVFHLPKEETKTAITSNGWRVEKKENFLFKQDKILMGICDVRSIRFSDVYKMFSKSNAKLYELILLIESREMKSRI